MSRDRTGRLGRLLGAGLVLGVGAVGAALSIEAWQAIGFPDGHRTPLDAWRTPLLPALAVALAVFSIAGAAAIVSRGRGYTGIAAASAFAALAILATLGLAGIVVADGTGG